MAGRCRRTAQSTTCISAPHVIANALVWQNGGSCIGAAQRDESIGRNSWASRTLSNTRRTVTRDVLPSVNSPHAFCDDVINVEFTRNSLCFLSFHYQ